MPIPVSSIMTSIDVLFLLHLLIIFICPFTVYFWALLIMIKTIYLNLFLSINTSYIASSNM